MSPRFTTRRPVLEKTSSRRKIFARSNCSNEPIRATLYHRPSERLSTHVPGSAFPGPAEPAPTRESATKHCNPLTTFFGCQKQIELTTSETRHCRKKAIRCGIATWPGVGSIIAYPDRYQFYLRTRRERDSNPRGSSPSCFQDSRNRPLCHPSKIANSRKRPFRSGFSKAYHDFGYFSRKQPFCTTEQLP